MKKVLKGNEHTCLIDKTMDISVQQSSTILGAILQRRPRVMANPRLSLIFRIELSIRFAMAAFPMFYKIAPMPILFMNPLKFHIYKEDASKTKINRNLNIPAPKFFFKSK